ncbi:hypothetical protein ACP4OV_010822 [Aristida adscensionis]
MFQATGGETTGNAQVGLLHCLPLVSLSGGTLGGADQILNGSRGQQRPLLLDCCPSRTSSIGDRAAAAGPAMMRNCGWTPTENLCGVFGFLDHLPKFFCRDLFIH